MGNGKALMDTVKYFALALLMASGVPSLVLWIYDILDRRVR